MRSIFGKLHRWAGLLTAAFLLFSGVTGAIISWDHELDDILNKKFHDVSSTGPAKSSIELAALIEQRDPHVRVNYLLTTAEKNESLSFFLQPRIDPATGKRYTDVNYNQVFLDPNTGEDEMAFANASLVPTAAADRDPKNPATWGKIGRNEDCPCGSGKKYKHCHGKYG